jgi:hypothetical protein
MSGNHFDDELLLREVDGELSASETKRVQAHLSACWKCRARRQELEKAIGDFVRSHELLLDGELPPSAGPRALLKARLGQISPAKTAILSSPLPYTMALCALLLFGLFFLWRRPARSSTVVFAPNAALTPGAALLVDRRAVCAAENANNRFVPVALRRKVFEQYGIPGADPRAYEIDYLITPALGGAEDIHNLWPHSNSSTMWNAKVKDALENRLRDMVCDGSLDLAMAQKEIAGDWIAAYKKYFHTEMPLPEHEN